MRSLLITVALVAALATAARFTAFESHVINVTAKVVHQPICDQGIAPLTEAATLDDPSLETLSVGHEEEEEKDEEKGDCFNLVAELDFGTVFPGETVSEEFVVCQSRRMWEHKKHHYEIDYDLYLSLKPKPDMPGFYPDLRPYILVQRDPAETDVEPDPDALGAEADFLPPDGIVPDYAAEGILKKKKDKCDRWIITVWVPHFVGEYQSITDPQGGTHGLLPAEATSDGWWLGADIKISAHGIKVIAGDGGG
jgi:hypothetical protein